IPEPPNISGSDKVDAPDKSPRRAERREPPGDVTRPLTRLGSPKRKLGEMLPRRRLEIHALDELARLFGPLLPLHAGVVQFHRQGAFVADVVEGADQVFPVDAATPGDAELPASARVSIRQVRTQKPGAAIEIQG